MTYSFCFFFLTLHSPSQVRLHGTVWNQGPEGIFSWAPSSVSNTLHRRPRVHQWHGDLHGVGQWQGAYGLGQRALGKNEWTGWDQRRSPKFKRAPVSLGQYSPRWAVRAAAFHTRMDQFGNGAIGWWNVVLFGLFLKSPKWPLVKELDQTAVHILRWVILKGSQL